MGLSWGKANALAEVDWRRLLPLAVGTLLVVLGLFAGWQTWLIAKIGRASCRERV